MIVAWVPQNEVQRTHPRGSGNERRHTKRRHTIGWEYRTPHCRMGGAVAAGALEAWALFCRGASAANATAPATPAESRAIGWDQPLSDRHDEETGARVSGTTGPRILK